MCILLETGYKIKYPKQNNNFTKNLLRVKGDLKKTWRTVKIILPDRLDINSNKTQLSLKRTLEVYPIHCKSRMLLSINLLTLLMKLEVMWVLSNQ